jgi:hypothetical protein
MTEISPLRRRMIDDMMIRNLSPATQQSYIYAVAAHSDDCEHPIRPIMNTGSGEHEHALAVAEQTTVRAMVR